MICYKVVSTMRDGTLVSAVVWNMKSCRTAYPTNKDVFFPDGPAMAFTNYTAAKNFMIVNAIVMRDPRVFLADADLDQEASWIHYGLSLLGGNTRNFKAFWRAVRQHGDLMRFNMGALPPETALCARVRLLEEVKE